VRPPKAARGFLCPSHDVAALWSPELAAMATAPVQTFDPIVAYLRERTRGDVSLADVVGLAEITTESMKAFFATMDAAVYRELREIADYIAAMKTEIGTLQPNELRESRIPAAGLELDAVVKATEAATNTIMESAETVMAADPSDPDAYKALVDEKMMAIFEACSFQDITGQRVKKVVETLQYIEARVTRFAEVVKAKDVDGYVNERERVREERKNALLLNGPQLAGEGVDQGEIDELLKAGDIASEADLEKLFR
jgi:chemotaxis protein CheZ